MSLLRGLSVWQPWAWLIVHGYKPIENRTWQLTYKGPLVIHASKRRGREQEDDYKEVCRLFPDLIPRMPPLRDMPIGGIVGIVQMVDCVTEHRSPWFRGPFGFVFVDAEATEFVEFPGKQGLFPVNASFVRRKQ